MAQLEETSSAEALRQGEQARCVQVVLRRQTWLVCGRKGEEIVGSESAGVVGGRALELLFLGRWDGRLRALSIGMM